MYCKAILREPMSTIKRFLSDPFKYHTTDFKPLKQSTGTWILVTYFWHNNCHSMLQI